MIRREVKSAGLPWLTKRGMTVSVGSTWDAAGTTNRKQASSMCGKVLDTKKDVNSPYALWGLCHWEGKDDWESVRTECRSVFEDQQAIIDNNNKLLIPFDDNTCGVCEVQQVLCADGAALNSATGGDGFHGVMPCLFCTKHKNNLAEETVSPKKTRKWFNNSCHCPRIWPLRNPGDFEAFTCVHCKKKFPTIKSVLDDHENSAPKGTAAYKKYLQSHATQVHTRYVLSPVDTILPCVLHVPLALVRHCWGHGIAEYIETDEVAEKINFLLETQCSVVLDVAKIAKGLKQDAARLPRLPGAPARRVVELFDCFLSAVLFCDDYDEDTEAHEVKQAHFKAASFCNDALLELWNCLSQRMQREVGMPPTMETRRRKARLLGAKAEVYRLRYAAAYGKSAFKPYTHMTAHLEEAQLAVEDDLMAYSGQAQEHFGKQFKFLVKTQTNHNIGGKNKDGSLTSSYIFQAAKTMMFRKRLRDTVPVPATDYMAKKLKKTNAQTGRVKRNHKMKKVAVFPVTRASISDRKATAKEESLGFHEIVMESDELNLDATEPRLEAELAVADNLIAAANATNTGAVRRSSRLTK